MSWSLSARGTKAAVLEEITRQSAATSSEEEQLASVKQLLVIQAQTAPEGNEITVAASGNCDAHGNGYVSVSFNARAPVKQTAEQSPVS